MILLNSITDWMSATAACVATIIAFCYTRYTYQLLQTTNRTLELTETSLMVTNAALDLNKKALEHSNKIAEYEIYMKITEVLNSSRAIALIQAILDDELVITDFPFEDKNTESGVKTTVNEFTQCVLDPFEDLAKFYEDGLISLKSIDSGFGYNIIQVCNCEIVDSLIKEIRDGDKKYYSGIENLYYPLLELMSEKEKGQCKTKIFI